MINTKIVDAYTLFKMQCSGNILNSYFPFLASIILEEKSDSINPTTIKTRFNNKYGIPVNVSFVNQILGVGVDNGSIVMKAGVYVADFRKLKHYCLNDSEFQNNWKCMQKAFSNYCNEKG